MIFWITPYGTVRRELSDELSSKIHEIAHEISTLLEYVRI